MPGESDSSYSPPRRIRGYSAENAGKTGPAGTGRTLIAVAAAGGAVAVVVAAVPLVWLREEVKNKIVSLGPKRLFVISNIYYIFSAILKLMY